MARRAKSKKTAVKSKAKPVKKAPQKPVKKAVKKAIKTSKKAPKALPAKKLLKLATPAKAAKSSSAIEKSLPTKTLAPPKVRTLTVGVAAPNFVMPATQVGEVSSVQLKGKPFILYFYPKDDTSGCTAEACEFRNTLPAFEKLGVTVIGVSKDSLESHVRFGSKYSLPFPLASDEGTKVCEAFGTWAQKSMYGRSYMGIERSTFLIDGKGVIRALWRKVSVSGHVDEVKKAVEAL